MISQDSPSKKHNTRRGRWASLMRGFTLTELMVAMSGGLIISISVFVLARQASRFYAREGRTAAATMAGIVGFERLRVDIARTGFMATPNIRRDPKVCGGPNPATDAFWPLYLKHLQSVFITPAGTGTTQLLSVANNGMQAQRITLAGNYASPDQYEVRDIQLDGTAQTYQVFLATDSNAVRRLAASDAGALGLSQSTLTRVFGTEDDGKAVRIVDPSGREHYGTVVGVAEGTQPQVLLSAVNPPLQTNTSTGCGIIGVATGSLMNPVNVVRYELRNLGTNADYAALYASGPPYDANTRLDLVREELNANGDPVSGTLELVAEYAVNLSFRLTGFTVASTGRLERVGMAGWADNTLGNPTPLTGPQLLRSIEATLSVRSREADRQSQGIGVDGGGGLLRFGVGSGGGGPYARVRTVAAEIALNNQLGVTWQ